MSAYWITKYALSAGIEKREFAAPASDDKYLSLGLGGWFRIGRDAFDTYEAAVANAEQRRVAKIKSLEKQIAKLRALSFAEPKP